ncbi:hypothetical protein V1512DRAFT_254038 [Lipomyces arxii]|uniref:uncharacterized protein n=1 Tax=Lipomyces arxii TaxID=56418 RepID=UPI0034CFFE80
MVFISIDEVTPVVAAGGKLSATINVVLEEETFFKDIRVMFRGTSFTAMLVSNGSTTYQVSEHHIHVDRYFTLLPDNAGGTTLSAGRHTFPVTIWLPVYSDCKCLARVGEYPKFRFARSWNCVHSAAETGDFGRALLPPSLWASDNLKVGYRLAVLAERPGLFTLNKSKMIGVNVLPVAVIDEHVPNMDPLYIEERAVHSAKCDKLPETYFVNGALPKATGFRKVFSLSSKHSYVNVPMKFELVLGNNATVRLNQKIPISICTTIDVDDVSRIDGIVDARLVSLRLVIHSVTKGVAQQLANSNTDRQTIYDLKGLNEPLVPVLKSEYQQVPKYQMEDHLFEDAVIPGSLSPDFKVMSLAHFHILKITVGMKFNGGSTKYTELSHALNITSGLEYDVNEKSLLPPSYDPGNYCPANDNKSIDDEKLDFFER